MKTTLITLSGMSPAIITETVWALALETDPVVADEVVVITTTRGSEDIDNQLLTAKEDWGGRTVWETLRADVLELTGQPTATGKLQLSKEIIKLNDEVTGVKQEAGDLRTKEDNNAAADFMVQIVSPYVDDIDNHVIASIAGGRKSMGALLYGTMSLIGKGTDRVTHVLVSEPFENSRGFFYPGQPVNKLEARVYGAEPVEVNAADAVVELADLMFVPLRNRFVELNEPRRSFSGLVDHISVSSGLKLARPPKVYLDKRKGILTVEGRRVPLAGRKLLVASFLYDRAVAGEDVFENAGDAFPDFENYYKKWLVREATNPHTSKLPSPGNYDDTLFTKGLNELRSRLTEKDLSAAVSFLAPKSRNIGFTIQIDEPAKNDSSAV